MVQRFKIEVSFVVLKKNKGKWIAKRKPLSQSSFLEFYRGSTRPGLRFVEKESQEP